MISLRPGWTGWSIAAALTLAVFLPHPTTTTSAKADEFGPVKPIEVKKELAALGKRLFYDTRLSGDTSLSCSSCH